MHTVDVHLDIEKQKERERKREKKDAMSSYIGYDCQSLYGEADVCCALLRRPHSVIRPHRSEPFKTPRTTSLKTYPHRQALLTVAVSGQRAGISDIRWK